MTYAQRIIAAARVSYVEAVNRLLGGEGGRVYAPAREQPVEKKEFALPPAKRNMRRVYAYLLQQRCVSREVLNHFVHAGLIYESCEPSKDGGKQYHNAVFVGKDEHGVARHAHKRGLYTTGPSFRGNVEGGDPRCSFHHTGSSDRLYVFKAPIDLLSFNTLYPKDWQQHSYVSLCGVSAQPMLWMLEQDPGVRKVALCLDNDKAGRKASERLAKILLEKGYDVMELFPEHKDWNEDVQALCGHPVHTREPESAAITMKMG